jgi:hypothetical protein
MNLDLSRLHGFKAANRSQYGGFATAGGAQETGNIPFWELETQAVDNPNHARAFLLGELNGDVFKGNQGWIGIHPYNFRIESTKCTKTSQFID